ncbi:MAG: hypothetical protein R2765_11015 [Ferruginibacter sp.]
MKKVRQDHSKCGSSLLYKHRAAQHEVLEKAPGVSVDKDGNINLKGKAGVIVYIDGQAKLFKRPRRQYAS